MALTNLGGISLMPVGYAGINPLVTQLPNAVQTSIDAVNEAVEAIGQIFWEDEGSHTVDTSGSSSIQWRSSGATFANAGTTVVVGLADVDAAAGPPARAVNSSDVITFDVSRSLTGGGGGIANGGWNTSVPTSGTKTIAHGDIVVLGVQMTARGGADTVTVSSASNLSGAGAQRPSVTSFLSSTYANLGSIPQAVIVAADGTLGFFFGGAPYNTGTATAFNSGSSPNERGNVITLPVPGKAYGFIYSCALAGATSNFDLVLYSDPLGTPAAQKTVSFDAHKIGAITGNLYGTALFSSPYTFAANEVMAAIYKPTTANTISPSYLTLANSAHMKAWSLGTAAYAVNRSSGAFSVQNSNLERYQIGLLIEAFDDGAGGGGPVGQQCQ